MPYNSDPNPYVHGSRLDAEAYARMAWGYSEGAPMPRTAARHDDTESVDPESVMKKSMYIMKANARERRRAARVARTPTVIKRLLFALCCAVCLLTASVTTNTVFAYLSHVPASVRLVPGRVVCEWVYVHRC